MTYIRCTLLTTLLALGVACGPGRPADADAGPSTAEATESMGETTAAPSAAEASLAAQAGAAPPPTPEELAKRDVLHYYRQLQPPYRPDYPLEQHQGAWRSRSTLTEEPIAATVDVRNGYIAIVDEGTGDGGTEVRVVLFRLADGLPMLGITETVSDGVGITQKYHFLRPEDRRQLDWTEHTLPHLTGFDFLPLDNAEEPEIVEKLLPVTISLPQKGTTVTAEVFTGLEYIYCRPGAGENEYSDYCGLFKRLRRKSIPLKWNRATGQFEHP